MRTPEQSGVSLDVAKKLEAAGYPQDESLWYWVRYWCSGEEDYVWELFMRDADVRVNKHYKYYAAPDVAELGERLPRYFRTYKFECSDGLDDSYACDNEINEDTWDHDDWKELRTTKLYDEWLYTEADTEADARGEMWLYLKARGLLPEKGGK